MPAFELPEIVLKQVMNEKQHLCYIEHPTWKALSSRFEAKHQIYQSEEWLTEEEFEELKNDKDTKYLQILKESYTFVYEYDYPGLGVIIGANNKCQK